MVSIRLDAGADLWRFGLHDGIVEKIPLLTADMAEARTVADRDIEENWDRDKADYVRGRRP